MFTHPPEQLRVQAGIDGMTLVVGGQAHDANRTLSWVSWVSGLATLLALEFEWWWAAFAAGLALTIALLQPSTDTVQTRVTIGPRSLAFDHTTICFHDIRDAVVREDKTGPLLDIVTQQETVTLPMQLEPIHHATWLAEQLRTAKRTCVGDHRDIPRALRGRLRY